MKKILILFLFSTIILSQTKTIDQRVDSVLSLMNLTEKVGQLIQFSGGELTGTKTARLKEGHIDLIRKGRVGSFLNIFGAENTKNIQKIAIEESRLKIPLLFGLDVIHGYKTIFPVPLAESCSWDPELVKYSARMQATEASSAKLPVTFPRSVGQIPFYYNHKNTGRPFDQNSFYTSKYIDEENSPLYPFGYGLSYTKFDYQNLSLDKSEIGLNESLKVSLEVHNSGEYDGEEIVQLYVRDLIGNVTRPVLELKDFQKVMIKAGETKSIEFILKPEQLKFYDQEMKYVVEPGRFKVYAGPNSNKLLEKEFLLLSK